MNKNKSQLVRKHNRLINASYILSLSEQRLILMAICNAEGTKDALTKPITIYARDFANLYSLSLDAAYTALKAAANQLFERKFSWSTTKDGKTVNHIRRWVFGIDYINNEGVLTIHFSPDVIPYLSELQKEFTSYRIDNIVNLTSAYAIRLYEIIISWRNVKSMPMMSIEELRQKLGVADDEYKILSNFKMRVLDFAVKQINDHSDINLSYRQHKQGRKVVGFSFVFESKNPTVTINMNDDADDLDRFFDNFYMTKPQIDFFSEKIAKLPSAQKEASPYKIKTNSDFIEYIRKDILVDPKKWWPYLLEVGFDKKYLAKKPQE